MWKRDRKDPANICDFLKDYPTFSQQILEFLHQFRIFLIPIQGDRRRRERIEAGIASNLYEKSGIVGRFQDNDIRYKPRRTDEKSFLLKIKGSEIIKGLSEELII